MFARSPLASAALALAVLALPGIAQAQSFNCRYARSADEVLVCQDPELSALDERLSRVFYGVRGSLGGAGVARLDEDQADWLSSRKSCGRNAACVEDTYRSRIRELRRY